MAHEAKWHKKCQLRLFDEQCRRESSVTVQQGSPSIMYTRSAERHPSSTEPTCFFCDKPAGSSVLHNASTYNIDTNVRRCALELEDTALLAKLSAGDMIAIEAKYHHDCLRSLYNRARQTTSKDNEEDSCVHGIAFAELVAFLEDMKSDEDNAPIFKLSDIARLYKDRLEQLGLTVEKRVHTTRLKNRLLSALPDLRAHSQGRDTLLSFEKDIGSALLTASYHDDDAMHLMRAAQVVRKEIFDTSFSFDGSFHENCQQETVPPSLLALVNMILQGASIKHQAQPTTKASLTISQLMMFNCVKHARKVDPSRVRHNRSRETPLPVYLSFKLHGVTRSKGLIDSLFELGLCISYDRLLQFTSDIANGICQRYRLEDVVCPPNLRHWVFTTAAVDNVDHNPSSATAKESFYGTGISLMQHPSHADDGHDRGMLVINQDGSSSKSVTPLPSSYTLVPPAALKTKDFTSPAVQGPVKPPNLQGTTAATKDEYAWLNKVKTALCELTTDGWLSWSSYHADMLQSAIIPPAAIVALLPLFLDNANSVAMIRHSMDIVMAAVQHLNPGQTPVLTADQPLYALVKKIQWTWPVKYGEDHFVVILGGLHIEMATLKLLGDWLEDSGWTNALVQADIASSGTANSFVHASHVTKTRHAHQVTAASLYTLLQRAYSEDVMSSDTDTVQPDILPFEEWCTQRAKASVHFDYWLKTLSLELLLLRYIRSNFQLYLEYLAEITPWMFALDHTHYSRWLPVHIRDMMALAEKHPDVLAEFQLGKFVVHKTSRKFSAMALDQCHEQNNAMVKGSGGAVGLTGNPAALRRWMIAGPEIARITTEFEEQALKRSGDTKHHHHDQQPAVQAAFMKEVKALVAVLEEMGNPFLEQSQDLLVIDTKDIMDDQVAETVRKVEALGLEQYTEFVQERLEQRTTPITETIAKNKLPLFSRPPIKVKSKQKEQLAALKSDCSLFSRLYISCQTRDGDMDNFFSHENQAAPPALSLGGKLRLGVKADLLGCLESDLLESNSPVPAPQSDAIILDGAAIVQMLSPGTAKTFKEYGDSVFAPYLHKQLEKSSRIDLVWDKYRPDSLKASTREKRGKGTRKRVTPSTLMPKNWKSCLCVNENKSELFAFLSREAIQLSISNDKEIYATQGNGVLCSATESNLASLAPCSHEEADTRLLLHTADAVQRGFRKVTIRTVDTDVVVLAIASFSKIAPDELWVAFGVGAKFRYLAIHTTASIMNPAQCLTLPVFHAFTGCDTVAICFRWQRKEDCLVNLEVLPRGDRCFLRISLYAK